MGNQSDSKRRFWRFKCGHIGGEVVMRHVGVGHVRTLMLYELSLTVEPRLVPLDALPLRGRIEGNAHDLRCTLCGRTRSWLIGEDMLTELMNRRLRRLHSAASPL